MTREEQWLNGIAGAAGAVVPDEPVWHYEDMLAAIYDAVTGAADPRPFPERSWHLDEFLYAVYCAVAGLADPGIPEPTCRIEEFWKGIYENSMGGDSPSVPPPAWRIEEFLAAVFTASAGWGEKTLTGAIVSFIGRAATTITSLSVPFSPIQSLNGYSSPWPAGGGKNKFLTTLTTETKNDVTATVNADGTISLTGTATAATSFAIGQFTFPVGTYFVSICPPGGSASTYRVYASWGANDSGSGLTRTFSQETTITFTLSIASGVNVSGLVCKPLICLDSESHTWEPYENICPISGRTGLSVYVSPTQNQADATTYASDWTSTAGTVYGGTVDVVTGVLTVDKVCVNLGDYDWTYDSTYTRFQHTFSNMKNLSARTLPMQCSALEPIYDGRAIGSVPDNAVYLGNLVVNVKYSAAGGNTATFKTAMNGVQLCYPLGSPYVRTYQLTPQQATALVGQNHVWSDTGENISVTVKGAIVS